MTTATLLNNKVFVPIKIEIHLHDIYLNKAFLLYTTKNAETGEVYQYKKHISLEKGDSLTINNLFLDEENKLYTGVILEKEII